MPHPNAKQDAITEKDIPNTVAVAATPKKTPSYSSYLDYLDNEELGELTKNLIGTSLKDPAQYRSFLFKHISEMAAARNKLKSSKNLKDLFELITQYAETSMEALELFIKSNNVIFLQLSSDKIINLLAFVCAYNRILPDNPEKNSDAQYVILTTLFKNRKIAERFLGYVESSNPNDFFTKDELLSTHARNKKLCFDVFTIILTSNSSKAISAFFENIDSYFYKDKNLPDDYKLKVQKTIKSKQINLANLRLSEIAKKRLNEIIEYLTKPSIISLKQQKIEKITKLILECYKLDLTSFRKGRNIAISDKEIFDALEILCNLFNSIKKNNNEEILQDLELQKIVWDSLFQNKSFVQKAFGYTAPNDLPHAFYNREMFITIVELIINSKLPLAISALFEAIDREYERRLPESLSAIVKEIITKSSVTMDSLELSFIAKWHWDLIISSSPAEDISKPLSFKL